MTKTLTTETKEKLYSGMQAGQERKYGKWSGILIVKNIANLKKIWLAQNWNCLISLTYFWLLRHHTPFSSQHSFFISAILHKIYGATVFKDDSIEVLDEWSSKCLPCWDSKIVVYSCTHVASSAAYFSHRKSYCYLVL